MTTETQQQETKPMNAKERRKLQREQERLEAEASAAAVASAPQVSKPENKKKTKSEATTTQASAATTSSSTTTTSTTAADKETPLNAKERRKLAREAERLAQEKAAATPVAAPAAKKAAKAPTTKAASASSTPAAVAPTVSSDAAAAPAAASNGEKLNAKQRRLLARKASRPEDSEKVTAKSASKAKSSSGEESKKRKRAGKAGDSDPNKKVKSIHLTLFIGQLPFNATEAKIREHFHEAGDIEVRRLTDKRTGKFKGTAFIEVRDSKALGAALSRHHSLLNGRRINVEMTASGGGNKSEQRRTKIDLLRKKQSNVQVEKTKALIQKHIDSREYKLTKDDVDDRMIDFLSWFDYETAKKALEEYNRCVGDRVKNRKAFFMGILKRFRETDGVE